MFYTNEPRTGLLEGLMPKVYGWMTIGLLLTACSGFALLLSPTLFKLLLMNPFGIFLLCAAQFGLVIYLTQQLHYLSYAQAVFCFLLYSALLGFSLAPIYLYYSLESILQTLIITAGMFGSMAVYGYWTNTDLSRFSALFRMGLIGLMIALFVNAFFASRLLDLYLSCFGVLLFTGLTAYDMQKIKYMALETAAHEDDEMVNKVAVFGALILYLDFVNLFLYLLRIMGKKRK